MPRKLIGVNFLRAENPLVLSGGHIELGRNLNKVLECNQIEVAHISTEFRDLYAQHWTPQNPHIGRRVLNRGTVRRPMPDDWVTAFKFWSGILFVDFLSAIAVQGKGGEGDLLTNGVLNGAICRQNPDWAMTARWHDPARPYHEQASVYSDRGWSFDVVSAGSRGWCPQGGIILFY